MRKPIQKILALCCVGVMAVAFASCAPDPKDDGVSTEASQEATEESTAAPTEAPSGGETAAPTDAPAPGPGGITKPANKGAAVKLYNDALAKAGAVSATVTRSLQEVMAGPINVLKVVPQVPEKFDLTDAPLEGAKLSNLDEGSVASMGVKESGDNFVIDFTLNPVNGNEGTAVGDGGYMYLLDFETVKTTVASIGASIDESFSISVKQLKSLVVENGKLTVTINKTTGAMSAASITFSEKISASVVTSATGKLAVTANIVGGGTVKYTVA